MACGAQKKKFKKTKGARETALGSVVRFAVLPPEDAHLHTLHKRKQAYNPRDGVCVCIVSTLRCPATTQKGDGICLSRSSRKRTKWPKCVKSIPTKHWEMHRREHWDTFQALHRLQHTAFWRAEVAFILPSTKTAIMHPILVRPSDLSVDCGVGEANYQIVFKCSSLESRAGAFTREYRGSSVVLQYIYIYTLIYI